MTPEQMISNRDHAKNEIDRIEAEYKEMQKFLAQGFYFMIIDHTDPDRIRYVERKVGEVARFLTRADALAYFRRFERDGLMSHDTHRISPQSDPFGLFSS